MTRAEELGWVYQIDLMYFERYEKWYHEGRLTADQAKQKLESELRILQAYRKEMEALPEDERPAEYFDALPVIPKVLYTPAANPDQDPEQKQDIQPASSLRKDVEDLSRMPAEITGQVNILDWLGPKLFQN